jgi:hypothetical protein
MYEVRDRKKDVLGRWLGIWGCFYVPVRGVRSMCYPHGVPIEPGSRWQLKSEADQKLNEDSSDRLQRPRVCV